MIFTCKMNCLSNLFARDITVCPKKGEGGDRRACDNLFIGGTLVTTKHKLITCAHRRGPKESEMMSSHKNMDGACYWMNLAGIPKYSPTDHAPTLGSKYLRPFLDSRKNLNDYRKEF